MPTSNQLLSGAREYKEKQVMDLVDQYMRLTIEAELTVHQTLIAIAAFRGTIEQKSGEVKLSDLK